MITLTFDDGLLNTYEVAFPIMEKYGVKGVAFIPTGIYTKELGKFREDKAPYMSLIQLKQMHKAGWEIGSHSHTHPFFNKISLEEAKRQLKISKQYLSDWGFQPISFAFPYGHGYYTPDQIDLARQIFRWVRTVHDFGMSNKMVCAIAADNFPPEMPRTWTVYVIHVVKDPVGFEKWLATLNEEITTFKEQLGLD